MIFKEELKEAIKSNPIANARRSRMRNELKNKDFTLLAPNCMGGILLHDLGLRFLTPTVNLMMTQTDFLHFVLDLDSYLKTGLEFYNHLEYSCPCAYLKPFGLPPISIHFTHYKSEKEAEQKWQERAERINKENLFVFLEERDGIGREELERLKSVKARGIVVFTSNVYKDLPYCVCLKKYHKQGEIGNILKKNYIDDSREYETYFDFVKWFNEADGGAFDVKPLVKNGRSVLGC